LTVIGQFPTLTASSTTATAHWLCSGSTLSALTRHSILVLHLMNNKNRITQALVP